jgi:hypothetical protein
MSRTWRRGKSSFDSNIITVQVDWCYIRLLLHFNLHTSKENTFYHKEYTSDVLKHTSTLLVGLFWSCWEVFFFYFIISAEHLLLENQDSASVTEKMWLVDGYHKVKCIENPPFRKFANFFTCNWRLLGLFWNTGYSRNTGNLPESSNKIRRCL